MDAGTYPENSVAAYINNEFIAVRVPAKSNPLGRDFNIKWTPALIVLGPEGVEHHRSIGFLDGTDVISVLMLGKAKYHFDHDRFAKTLDLLKEVQTKYPNTPVIPEAVFLAGVCNYKLKSETIYLREMYETLSRDYPDSEWARRAAAYKLL